MMMVMVMIPEMPMMEITTMVVPMKTKKCKGDERHDEDDDCCNYAAATDHDDDGGDDVKGEDNVGDDAVGAVEDENDDEGDDDGGDDAEFVYHAVYTHHDQAVSSTASSPSLYGREAGEQTSEPTTRQVFVDVAHACLWPFLWPSCTLL